MRAAFRRRRLSHLQPDRRDYNPNLQTKGIEWVGGNMTPLRMRKLLERYSAGRCCGGRWGRFGLWRNNENYLGEGADDFSSKAILRKEEAKQKSCTSTTLLRGRGGICRRCRRVYAEHKHPEWLSVVGRNCSPRARKS